MKLKGVCVHHDAGCLGAAVPEKVWERRLRSLKELGVNAIRTSHKPPAPELLDLCDRLGLLVKDEAFDEFTPAKNKWVAGRNNGLPARFGYAEDLVVWSVRDMQGLFRRDRNHPSVIMSSIGNEIDYANDPFSHPVLGEAYRPENPPAEDLVKHARPFKRRRVEKTTGRWLSGAVVATPAALGKHGALTPREESMAKSIMITGASSGLGEGMARHLARRGHRLALCARRRERLDTLARELAVLSGGEPIVEELDVTDYASIAPVMDRVARRLGRIDVVVANACIALNTPIGKGRFDDVRRTIETNLLGAVATIEAAVELFRKQGGGHVVAISSVAAVRGMKGQGAYSASKSGLSRYLESLRAEATGENIRVTDLVRFCVHRCACGGEQVACLRIVDFNSGFEQKFIRFIEDTLDEIVGKEGEFRLHFYLSF